MHITLIYLFSSVDYGGSNLKRKSSLNSYDRPGAVQKKTKVEVKPVVIPETPTFVRYASYSLAWERIVIHFWTRLYLTLSVAIILVCQSVVRLSVCL